MSDNNIDAINAPEIAAEAAQEFAVVPETGFRQIAEKVQDVYKHLQGRTVTRKALAGDLWKLKDSTFSVCFRAAVDFGLLACTGDAVSLTKLSLKLGLVQPDSPEWLALAAQGVQASKITSALIARYGLDATTQEIRSALVLEGMTHRRVNVYLPVFKGCVDILRKANGTQPASEPVKLNAQPSLDADHPLLHQVLSEDWAAHCRHIHATLTELGLLPPSAA